MKIGVIGAGASGMIAAATAAEQPENEILLFERQARVGRKLLATGNGRCNLSHWDASSEHYHGSAPDFVQPALAQFSVTDTLSFFRSHGLLTVSDHNGRIYPFSDQANSVVDVLRFSLQRPNIRLLCGCEVNAVTHGAGCFTLKTPEERFRVDRLIVACGGAAGSKLGGGLSGYQLLGSLGHHCTQLFPALVQLRTETAPIRGLKGIRTTALIRLRYGDSLLAESRGEVQFTDYGISGPAIFEISRAAATAPAGAEIHLDLLPEVSTDMLVSAFCIRVSQQPDLPCGELLTGMLQNRLGRMVLRAAQVSLEQPLRDLTWGQLTAVVEIVHDFVLPVTGTMGMDCAQVTAGGVDVKEFDPESLQSRIVPGLFACGEVLDVDGDCGGYNLQWAWSSGRLAGRMAGC